MDKKPYLKMKQMDQKKLIAGRSIKEILQRFEKKMREPRSKIEGKFISKILNEFLKISCSLNSAKSTLEKFEKKYQVNLKLNKSNIFKLKLNNKNLVFSTNIGRTAEYYSGIVFEIFEKENNLNLASGGRYDGLMQVLGAKKSIPAIVEQ